MRPGRESRTRSVARIARRGTITPQHEPTGREHGGVEIDGDPAHVERDAECVVVGEVGWDDEARRLRVEQGEVGVADGRGGLVGYLGAGVRAADAARGEGDVLLKPDEIGGDGGAQVSGRVDHDGDVGFVEGEGAADGGGV